MNTPLDRIVEQQIAAEGWELGSTLENRAAHLLGRWGAKPQDCSQQHRVGKYHLDFAWPQIRVAIEVDGWHHQRPDSAVRDAERDSWLRGQNWIILRVDDRGGKTTFIAQLQRAWYVIQILLVAGHWTFEPLGSECPYCGARVGEPCRDAKGYERIGNHAARSSRY